MIHDFKTEFKTMCTKTCECKCVAFKANCAMLINHEEDNLWNERHWKIDKLCHCRYINLIHAVLLILLILREIWSLLHFKLSLCKHINLPSTGWQWMRSSCLVNFVAFSLEVSGNIWVELGIKSLVNKELPGIICWWLCKARGIDDVSIASL